MVKDQTRMLLLRVLTLDLSRMERILPMIRNQTTNNREPWVLPTKLRWLSLPMESLNMARQNHLRLPDLGLNMILNTALQDHLRRRDRTNLKGLIGDPTILLTVRQLHLHLPTLAPILHSAVEKPW